MQNTETITRFLDAHEHGYDGCPGYETALREVRQGHKKSHWMWYIFPQMRGIARYPSEVTQYFELKSEQEALAFIQHPVLRAHLCEISEALTKLDTCDPLSIFEEIDAYKLRSCTTLFSVLAPEESVFAAVLEQYCMGIRDDKTLRILHRNESF